MCIIFHGEQKNREELTDIPELNPERVAITAMLYIVFRGTGPMSGRAKRDARAAKASRRLRFAIWYMIVRNAYRLLSSTVPNCVDLNRKLSEVTVNLIFWPFPLRNVSLRKLRSGPGSASNDTASLGAIDSVG